MRAFLYIRVSDDEQAREGFSIPAQEALLRRKCEEWKYEIIDIFIDDGYSAKNLKRPDFQRMLSSIDKYKAGVIVFWRLDRFSRRSRDFQRVMEELESKGCGIRSATENIDTTTAMGRFQLELAISLGQLERETTAERVSFVMEERHLKGLRNGAIAPYGYKLVDGQLIISPKHAEVVRYIYELYQKPMSTRTIAKLLNKDPIKYPRETGTWSDFAVTYILTNPTYCGKLRWNYRKLSGRRTHREIIVNGSHEAIVTPEEFERIQIMRKNRYIRRDKVSSDFHLSGVLKCARCGYALIGLTQRDSKTGKSRRFYRCSGRANRGVCNLPHLQEQIVVEAFLNALEPGSELFKKLVVINEVAPTAEDYEQETIKRELDNIQRRRKKWQEAYANDVISLEELRTHMEEEKAKENFFKSKLLPNIEPVNQWSQNELLEMVSQFGNLWNEIENDQAKKAFVREVFKEIVINTPVEVGVARPGKKMPVEIINWSLNT